MTSNGIATQGHGSPRRVGPSADGAGAGGGPSRVKRWAPLALGTAVIAGLASRPKGNFVLIALAGATAVAVVRGGRRGGHQARADESAVERSITIGKTADALEQRWRDPATLPQITAGFATTRPTADGRLHWNVEGPIGRRYEWDTEIVDGQPGEGIGWRSLEGAVIPNDGSIRFRPAPADRGSVVTLRVRFDPPDDALGHAAVKLLSGAPLKAAVDQMLRRFKALVETGEIPTTERQPAARADTR